MTIHSYHNAENYLYELRQNLGSSTDFGVERFTGIVIGRFFCITRHCSYEWEYKHTCQKNTAIGRVDASPSGCDVHYFTTAGELRPQFLIPGYLIFILISLIFTQSMQLAWHFIGVLTLAAILSALIEPMTTPSKEGKEYLLSLLADPRHPYGL